MRWSSEGATTLGPDLQPKHPSEEVLRLSDSALPEPKEQLHFVFTCQA